MRTSKIVVGALALAAAGSGIRAAWLLLNTTNLQLDPGWDGVNTIEPVGDIGLSNQAWGVAQFELDDQVSALNRRTAFWTIASTVSGAQATIVGLLPLLW
ncbi:hypothetical protein [Paraburkholderia haematera]|jgi:hypothetical protein|uniref:Uncharacterized protein n=1 Tax=Paraburkholderia haematera TaxID=2793077 RepID=A0ABM8QPZ0_9BURK|nr:hypothetical protein [Paraburkholderia haematera]CAE6708945.1 hypothetical protein R69888_01040 [Paraburkholderia haematera]